MRLESSITRGVPSVSVVRAAAVPMAAMPDNCRDILDRFFARDESYRTIGEALDLPAGTVASRISRCLDKLKALLEETGAANRREDG